MKTAPIGVVDSGVGGLTVVRHLQRMLPGEDIIYLGDGANCPYGNRTPDDLEKISRRTIGFLKTKGVKAVVVACNTTSSLIDQKGLEYGVPVFTLIAPAAQAVARCGSTKVGLIATEFTVHSGSYAQQIHALRPDVDVVAKGSPTLAALIDRGDFDDKAIDADIFAHVGDILCREAVTHLILGCTHYPIVEENFRRCFPFIQLIDPAQENAAALKAALQAGNGLNPAGKGHFAIYTTGNPSVYVPVAARLGLTPPDSVEQVAI